MPHDASFALTPDERVQRVAAILTQGVIRFHRRIQRAASAAEVAKNSPATCLEVPRETRLSVSRVVG
jgi:hypothetical protein